MKSARLIKVIKQDGWKLVPTKGRHHFKHPTKKGIVTIPHPKKDIPKGTVANILRQADL
ncbi:MAG: type II toxin-antitoxin system HicA family toxin [Flavobacteriaceae bacterium]